MDGTIETTLAGQNFYNTGLAHFRPADGTIGLPGLGKKATKKCIRAGYKTADQIFGLYLMFGRNNEVFLEYLENQLGIVFVGNKYADRDAIKSILCDTLNAKYLKVREFIDNDE